MRDLLTGLVGAVMGGLIAYAWVPEKIKVEREVVTQTEIVEVEIPEKKSPFYMLINNGQEMTCLAMNIYHEARGESVEGMTAVAFVTLNRVAADSYPDTICGVVNQRNSRGCQFSWTCDGKSDAVRNIDALSIAFSVAQKVVLGYHKIDDPTKGAIYYHADYVTPRWSKKYKRVAMIGNHLFYHGQ